MELNQIWVVLEDEVFILYCTQFQRIAEANGWLNNGTALARIVSLRGDAVSILDVMPDSNTVIKYRNQRASESLQKFNSKMK